MAFRIFISYSSEDRPIANRLVTWLEGQGHQCFPDTRRSFPQGSLWRETLVRELTKANAILVLISRQSMESDWFKLEAAFPEAKGKAFIPVLLAGTPAPAFLSNFQGIHPGTKGEREWQLLADRLGTLAGRKFTGDLLVDWADSTRCRGPSRGRGKE